METMMSWSVHASRLIIRGSAPDLGFFHADGRPYGRIAPTPPPDAGTTAGPRTVKTDPVFADALSGLIRMGWKQAQARAALAAVASHVGPAAQIEDVLRAALKELARSVRHS